MLSDITIGQYFPGNSLLHRMDPRVKILLLLFFLIGVFVFDTVPSYALFSILTLACFMVSRIPLRMMLRSVRPLLWIILFTFFIHLFSTPGEEMARIWIFGMTWEGLRQGCFISLRLVLLILLSSLLTFTTSPLKLTDAMERLLSPLKKLGVPAHELAMMMTIALRFIPTLVEETDKIMKAQQSRGSDFTTGNILQKARHIVPILVPLFISSFRRADELAMAMEARCYHGGEGRTQMKMLKVTSVDYLACGGSILFGGLLAFLKWNP